MVQVERDVERRLVALVRRAGGWAPKWVSPGTLGVPDRIVFLPGGRVLFVEVKRPGGRPRPSQEAVHRRLARLGVPVVVRSGLFNGYIAAETVRRVEGSFRGAFKILQAQIHIYKNGLMAPLAQGFTYRGGSDQGDMALGTEAAAQNNDLHGNHPFRGIKNRASMNMA